MKPFDPVKLVLWLSVGFILIAFLAFTTRHRPRRIPTVEISAEPSPAAMPTGLPR